MGRHGFQFCMLCNPEGNGSTGRPGTEAVRSFRSPKNGVIPVCGACAQQLEAEGKLVKKLPGKERRTFRPPSRAVARRAFDAVKAEEKGGPYDHEWLAFQLGTERVKAWTRCLKCHRVERLGMEKKKGCTVPDWAMVKDDDAHGRHDDAATSEREREGDDAPGDEGD